MSWRTLLVLGGIESGRVGYAEGLLGDPAGVRRLAAGATGDLATLARAVADTGPGRTLLVDDLSDWLPAAGGAAARDRSEPAAGDVSALVTALAACPGRVVLVSPEVGLSAAPTAAADRRFAAAVGALNRAVAAAVEAVVLVVAGQPGWLKGGPPPASPTGTPVAAAPAGGGADSPVPELGRLGQLPTVDDQARSAAAERLAALGAVALGALADVVTFAAGTQGSDPPAAWHRPRLLVLHGGHRGGVSAGPALAAARADALRAGTDPLALLAAPAGAELRLVEAAAADPIEDGPAMPEPDLEPALSRGWRLAEEAAEDGVDVLALGSIGDGADAAAAAVAATLAPSTEPAALLARVRTPEGTVDDAAWMARCAAVRDAVHRARSAVRATGRPALTQLGGPDVAVAAGLLLGAAARRTPVVLDGPVGAAAALAARNLAAAARHWWLLPDAGGHPLVTRVRETLGLTPLLDLRLELGEGAGALAALPLLRTALVLGGRAPGGGVAG